MIYVQLSVFIGQLFILTARHLIDFFQLLLQILSIEPFYEMYENILYTEAQRIELVKIIILYTLCNSQLFIFCQPFIKVIVKCNEQQIINFSRCQENKVQSFFMIVYEIIVQRLQDKTSLIIFCR